jgi:hypothetical protein
MTIVLLWFFLAILPGARADGSDGEKPESTEKWFVSVYGGTHTDENLAEIAALQATYSKEDYLVVCALAREIYKYQRWISVELEGQAGKHFGTDDQWEFVGLVLGRWHPFPWDEYIDTSFAFGSGLSYNSETSQIELDRDQNAQRLLGYLAFEFAFGLPQYPRWQLMLRIHHRSGAKGLIGEGASNYLCGGLKFAF